MSTWQVALIREQGVEFAVVCVKDHVLNSPSERDALLARWTAFLRRPVALLGAERHQTFGRRDIVDWLASIQLSQIPWQQMTIAA
jgi:hypothetical protein